MNRLFLAALLPLVTLTAPLAAQTPLSAKPTVGLRDNRPQNYALVHAHVVISPKQTINDATVLIQQTTITAVGKDLEIPPGFMVIDCAGQRIYPGLIDAWGEADVPLPKSKAGYWNGYVTPERTSGNVTKLPDANKLRKQGITVKLIAPKGGIVKGTSAVYLLDDSVDGRAMLRDKAWHHLALTVPKDRHEKYPNSPMGAVALLRQTLYDARWYQQAWNAYLAKPDLPRPDTNVALDVLSKVTPDDYFVIDAPNERMAIRAERIAKEFSLNMILRGSGREYRALEEIAEIHRPVLVPIDFPQAPDVSDPVAAAQITQRELMHWDLAPKNPAWLAAAGVSICLTTDSLSDVGEFLDRVRTAVENGLSEQDALAALTTTPAELLGIGTNTGRVRAGMLANLIVTDGNLFGEDTKILQTWVAGKQFFVDQPQDAGVDELVGNWRVSFKIQNVPVNGLLKFERKEDKLWGKLQLLPDAEDKKAGDSDEPATANLDDLIRGRDHLTASINFSKLGDDLPSGTSRLRLVTVPPEKSGAAAEIFASLATPDGQTIVVSIQRAAGEEDKPTADGEEDTERDEPAQDDAHLVVDTPLLTPLGACGLSELIWEMPTTLFRGATIWTCDEEGVLEQADLLIRDGVIVAVGSNLEVPENCQVVDARGKHITPGLIDCHSHMGTDGGVNESGQAVTAEVRIGDFIDNSDINIYRQLAGGLTIANILHGSANPIGGQNQVIKLRWGQSMNGLRMAEAPGGIKFALGENVKRNQSRYPNTRMGVEQIIADQLLAAREYDALWRRWQNGQRTTLPPRVDLQLEALAEVQRGERWIHCHSYRQDEILATLDVLEEFGIRIGTLQHILEGYKVADRMKRHGAMGSAFSDWWAYKFEVFDAIPYNGALMHQQGVVVSFNSDNRELARHLNTEAAKATKYGAVPEQEALKFVTLNPAKQLRIDQYVGSLTPGKHADLVVWSGRPLSTTSRCEQTWIDGKRYFDLQTDLQMRARDQQIHQALVRKALSAGKPKKSDQPKEIAEEDRWARYDVFCRCNSGQDSRGTLSR